MYGCMPYFVYMKIRLLVMYYFSVFFIVVKVVLTFIIELHNLDVGYWKLKKKKFNFCFSFLCARPYTIIPRKQMNYTLSLVKKSSQYSKRDR